MKKGITVKQFKKLNPRDKCDAVAKLLDECAVRCQGNMLVAGTWVEQSFEGAAARVRDIAAEIGDTG